MRDNDRNRKDRMKNEHNHSVERVKKIKYTKLKQKTRTEKMNEQRNKLEWQQLKSNAATATTTIENRDAKMRMRTIASIEASKHRTIYR